MERQEFGPVGGERLGLTLLYDGLLQRPVEHVGRQYQIIVEELVATAPPTDLHLEIPGEAGRQVTHIASQQLDDCCLVMRIVKPAEGVNLHFNKINFLLFDVVQQPLNGLPVGRILEHEIILEIQIRIDEQIL